MRTSALLTAMDTPLGRAVGNALEVEESVAVLRGEGPADLVQVTLALAAEMLRLAGIDADPAAALADGRALDRYRAMIAEQGGDPDAELPRAAVSAVLTAPETGWLRRLDARAVGVAAWRLGAGRARKEDPVSAAAGVLCLAKPGERVEAGQPVLELRTDDESLLAGARAALAGAIEIGDEPPPEAPAGDRAHQLRCLISLISLPARDPGTPPGPHKEGLPPGASRRAYLAVGCGWPGSCSIRVLTGVPASMVRLTVQSRSAVSSRHPAGWLAPHGRSVRRSAMTWPAETLSPTATRMAATVPATGAGMSSVALSDSRVISGSLLLTTSPAATCTSITGTSMKWPISGTATLMTPSIPLGEP